MPQFLWTEVFTDDLTFISYMSASIRIRIDFLSTLIRFVRAIREAIGMKHL